jgi:hypothetical protein
MAGNSQGRNNNERGRPGKTGALVAAPKWTLVSNSNSGTVRG